MFCGIDWGNVENVACVVSSGGEVIEERTFEHTPEGLLQLLAWLQGFEGIKTAIEKPHGPVVEGLLERDLAVYAINPKQLDRFRDRFTAAGAKDDRRDARVLASSLRTDESAFRRVERADPWVIELREWSHIHDELGTEEVRLGNRIREQLQRYYPQILACGDVNENWILALWELAPTPASAQRLTLSRAKKLLAENRIRRIDAETVVRNIRGPGFKTIDGTVEAASAHVKVLLPQLRLVLEQRKGAKRKLESLLSGGEEPKEKRRAAFHQDIQRLQTLPGSGTVVVSTVIAEAARPLMQRDYQTLRTYAGAAPVTKRSGKSLMVVRRNACNPRLQNALYHWARIAVQNDSELKAKYVAQRQAGHSHGRALRAVGDKLLKILCAMLRDGTDYLPPELEVVEVA